MRSKTPSLPNPDAPISVAELARYAELEPEARALAIRASPKADQTAPSKPEAKAIELIEGRIASRNDQRHQHARQLEVDIAALPNPYTDRNLEHLDKHVTDALITVFKVRFPVIRETVAAERNAAAELNAFRDRFGLTREADYPLSRIQHFANVVLILLIEAAINSFLFIDAVSTGLAGALITAILIAAANVALAVFIGLVPLRYLLNARLAKD